MDVIILVEDGRIKCVLRDEEFVNMYADDFVRVGNWECQIQGGEIIAEYVHEYHNLFMRHIIATARYTVSKDGQAKLVRSEDESIPEETIFDEKIMPHGVKKGLLVLHDESTYLDLCEANFYDYSVSAPEYDQVYERYIVSTGKKIKIYYKAENSVRQKGAGARGRKKAALVS